VVKKVEVDDTSKFFIESGFRKLPLECVSYTKNFGNVVGYVLAEGGTCDDAMRNALNVASRVSLY